MLNLTSPNRHKDRGTHIRVPHIDEGFKGVKKCISTRPSVNSKHVNYKQFYLDDV